MPTTSTDRMFLDFCFFLMALSLRLLRLARRLDPDHHQ